MGGPTIDDAAAGITGVLGSTVMLGIGAAGGMAVVNMVDRMGRKATQAPRKRKRKR
jgi:hypothetical protein